MIPSEHEFLREAMQQGYAIPAFNFSDSYEFLGIVEAAREEKARVYLCTNERVLHSTGLPYCTALGRAAYADNHYSMLLHLDHAKSVALCKKAVDGGYHSVMVDASEHDLQKNIAWSKEVAAYAHAKGVLVEAEIGKIMGNTMEGSFSGGDFLADVDEAAELVAASGVDSLAVGIGNAHGFYAAPPQLNIRRLKEIHAVVDVPLVLHGGTGIPEEQVRACIANGIAKINVGTLLHSSYLAALRRELARERKGYAVPDVFEPAKEAVKAQATSWIRLCAAGNRA
jgi:ketose-bisphosphate aldolase